MPPNTFGRSKNIGGSIDKVNLDTIDLPFLFKKKVQIRNMDKIPNPNDVKYTSLK
jgi:hypothetical protein